MTVIDEIKIVVDSLRETERTFYMNNPDPGYFKMDSDKHLVRLLLMKERLGDVTARIKQLVESIYNNFNHIDKDIAGTIIIQISPIFIITQKLNSILSDELYEGIKQSREEFKIEVDDFYEIVNDLLRYKLAPIDYSLLMTI
ncbi:hypothetical protein DVR12_18925 [Chitinophaga silvatica]|uniref:Uncharacterized protein n=1 Tax=Chitinophaga silvatica TaxID=2282649 RepID=A0A3E1Y6U9_9BACT|nr:hypothetical protein [Chitinophaga silvatica]RFS20637.1 hypothetical protein DVR12_18925 [Chitinophaga silvatica]